MNWTPSEKVYDGDDDAVEALTLSRNPNHILFPTLTLTPTLILPTTNRHAQQSIREDDLLAAPREPCVGAVPHPRGRELPRLQPVPVRAQRRHLVLLQADGNVLLHVLVRRQAMDVSCGIIVTMIVIITIIPTIIIIEHINTDTTNSPSQSIPTPSFTTSL